MCTPYQKTGNSEDFRQYYGKIRDQEGKTISIRSLCTMTEAILFGVLWDASKEERLFLRPIQRLADRTHTSLTAAKRMLLSLERKGLIRREGQGTKRYILFLYKPADLPIKISPFIWNNQDITLTQKVIWATIGAFQKVHAAYVWYERIGISPKVFYYEVQELKRALKMTQGALKVDSGGTKSNTIYGRDMVENMVEMLNKFNILPDRRPGDKVLTTLPEAIKQIHPETNNNQPERRESKMAPDIYGPEFDSLREQYPAHRRPHGMPPPRRCLELERQVMSLPNMVQHRFGTGNYKRSAQALKALSISLAAALSPAQLHRMEERMSGPSESGLPPLTQKQITDFQNKKFTLDERKELYLRLSRYYDPAYNRYAKGHANLADALYSFASGYCLLAKLWYFPPRLPKISIIKLDPELLNSVRMVQDALGDHSVTTRAIIMRNIRDFNWFFQKSIRRNMTQEQRYHWGEFELYLQGYIDYLTSHWKYRNANSFQHGSPPAEAWRNQMQKWTSDDEMDMADYFQGMQ